MGNTKVVRPAKSSGPWKNGRPARPPQASERGRFVDQKEKKVALISLGCPKNLVDSERFLAALIQRGIKFTSSYEDADALLINTCSFIDDAKEESIDVILQAAQLKRTRGLGSIIVAGCLGKRYGEGLKREIPEIDLVHIWVPRSQESIFALSSRDSGSYHRF